MEFEKIAIANRGEVAVRIIRACQELGITSVLLHSEADRQSLAYRLCDESVCIGDSPVGESYLNIANNIDAAVAAGADAIHPGFGFLSENAEFAKTCHERRVVFIGPSAEAIHLFGDKVQAKALVEKTKVPLIPGYSGDCSDFSVIQKEAAKIGYPVMVKAAGGGGGRGLRVVYQEFELQEAVIQAQREAESSFGSSVIFLEKYLDRAKHIEVQIFGAANGEVFHLGERECSVQRRHQKVIEEAPAALLNENLRQKICEAAVTVAKAAKYRGAGTVEFLVQDGEFYFLEMNTRLQVEHPVTELVMGVDLVKSQILTAQEKSLLWSQDEIRPSGHSIECRIYAEDPYANGIPSVGRLLSCLWPAGPGRRFEVGFEAGDEVTSFYDSMIAKVIVWDETRARAVQKMRRTLEDTVIFGLKTNIPYLLEILKHQDFVSGEMHTGFLGTHFGQGLTPTPLLDNEVEIAEKALQQLAKPAESSAQGHPSPWQRSWRLS